MRPHATDIRWRLNIRNSKHLERRKESKRNAQKKHKKDIPEQNRSHFMSHIEHEERKGVQEYNIKCIEGAE